MKWIRESRRILPASDTPKILKALLIAKEKKRKEQKEEEKKNEEVRGGEEKNV